MDLDLLPPRLLVLLTDLDLLDEHHRQLPGECLQLQLLPGFGHDLLLIAGRLLLGELLLDLCPPALQAALFRQKILDAGMTQSMSRVGRCIDNGSMEGFWGIMKREMYYGKK